MKATICYLENETSIITFDNSEFDRPSSVLELKRANVENLLIGDYDRETRTYSALLDDKIIKIFNSKMKFGFFGDIYNVVEIF